MKLKTNKVSLRFPINLLAFLFLITLLGSCKSQPPAFSNAPASATQAPSSGANTAPPATAPTLEKTPKPLGEPAQKLLYDSTKVSFKIKQKTEVETRYKDDDDDDDDDEDEVIISSKSESVVKYRKREKEKGNWLSGGFLASGTALLLAALVLVIIGSGPAGWLAIIGGTLFLAGFIFTMVALLSR